MNQKQTTSDVKCVGSIALLGSVVWNTRDTIPVGRVVGFSSCYPYNDPMRWRIMDGQFVRICQEVELWAYLEPALPNAKISDAEIGLSITSGPTSAFAASIG